ncbi:MAG: FeoA family protein [Cyanobacteria bacterium J06600_6]
MKSKIDIKELTIGSQATIVGYKTAYGGYVGKLLSKGLTVGKTLIIVSFSQSEDMIEILVEKQLISLSKPEADALLLTTLEKD